MLKTWILHVSCYARKNNNHCNIDNWADILSQAVLVFGSELVFGVQLICGLVLVLDAEPVLGAHVRLVQSRCLELVFGEKLVSGAEWPVLEKSSSLVGGTLVISWGGLRELSNRLVIWGKILILNLVFQIPAGLKWKTC